MKNLYKIALFLILACGVIFAMSFNPQPAGLAQTEPETSDTQRTVNVMGNGQVSASPDLAVIRLGVENEAETAGEAMIANNEASQAIIDAMLVAGIEEEDIQTQSISIFPRYDQSPDVGRGELLGYTARNIIQIKVRDIEATGDILDAAVQAGGNIVENIYFDISNPERLLAVAREAAMEDARQKAAQLVSLAGAQLGPVLTIQEFSTTPVHIEQIESIADAGGTVPISPGTQTIQVQVNVTWLIQAAILEADEVTPSPTP